MPRHFYLGNDRHVAISRVGHDVADLILRVEAAIALAVVCGHGPRPSDHGLASKCTHLGEKWILLDFDSPSLIVGEVPVKRVELVRSEKVDVAFDEIG